MNKMTLVIAALLASACSGCTDVQTYRDYPWGDYAWESNHSRRVNNIEAWDDYYHVFGVDQPRPPGG